MVRFLGLMHTITSIASDSTVASHVRVSQQIDGVCVSADLIVKAASFPL